MGFWGSRIISTSFVRIFLPKDFILRIFFSRGIAIHRRLSAELRWRDGARRRNRDIIIIKNLIATASSAISADFLKQIL